MTIAIESRGYANPELLVSTGWLESHLHDPDIRIVDTDLPGEYPRTHIPTAVPVQDHYYKQSNNVHIQDPVEFEQTMSSLGISDSTLVVPYDSSGGLYATRLGWSLHYYGHDRVGVLDGGFPKWFSEGRPLSRENAVMPTGSFTSRRNALVFASRDDVRIALDDPDTILLDVRASDEWSGENRRDCMRGGRIPGAVHLEWKNFVTEGEVSVFKPADELIDILTEKGVTRDKQVITY